MDMEDRTDLRPDDEGDAKLAEILREVYAPPAEGAYWDGLEARIMANIAEHRSSLIPVNWWSDLASWMAPGMAAAALLFVAAGMLWSRQKDEDMRTTYEAVTEPRCVRCAAWRGAGRDSSARWLVAARSDVPLRLVTLRIQMDRSKGYALMFLLGRFRHRWRARLHGRSRDRCRPQPRDARPARLQAEDGARSSSSRPQQQASVDSLIEQKHRQIVALYKPVKPQLDSIAIVARVVSDSTHAQIKRLLNPDQQAKLDRMRAAARKELADRRGGDTAGPAHRDPRRTRG